ncbi:MAG: DUF2061 domain-containing protein [Euryarchaeota archaeon]|nr:DUF2061 domain-containing protein [Euryarchaeota archaeon]
MRNIMTAENKNTPNRIRTLMKSITFRISATITTVLLVFSMTNELSLAFQFGLIEFIVKLFLYYSHERAWNIVRWGKVGAGSK